MQTSNRTFICSVVFLDIVGYSKKPVADQIQLKERLNALLTEALANVAVNDRIILDTGDGAALSFLGAPEDALFASLSLRDALATPQPHGPDLALRLGINLGPVKLVRDINGQPNIIGDGINVAQRVMSFSEAGQILVSRSYYEVVSCLSEDYGKLFHHEGSRTDKHVREHEVYAVEATGEALQRVAAATPRKKEASRGGAVVFDKLSQSASIVADNLRRKPRLGTALAIVAILAIAVALRLNRQATVAPVAAPSPPPPKVVVAPPPPAPAREAAKPAVPEKRAAARSTEKAASAEAAATESKPPAPAGTGVLLFTIRPWGEVYVDGKHRGDVPPLYELRLSAGKHRLEIRHLDYPPYVRTVEITPGARIDIKHWFVKEKVPLPSIPLPWK